MVTEFNYENYVQLVSISNFVVIFTFVALSSMWRKLSISRTKKWFLLGPQTGLSLDPDLVSIINPGNGG